MGSPTASSDLTFSDLERSKSRTFRLQVVGEIYVMHIVGCHIKRDFVGRPAFPWFMA